VRIAFDTEKLSSLMSDADASADDEGSEKDEEA
jgi:hypothetical protein